jgi:phosphatidylinositol alpha 1,6-mannosyltransferase
LAPVSKVPGVKVVIVGEGPERHHLERAIPRAEFVGFQGGVALSQLHASFDVFAHTGLDETFCQAVQEALASGVPVVAPAAGGPIDLVQHGRNGYLWSPELPGMLAGAVAELANDPARRREMGRAGRESVLARPWSAVMDELMDHYRCLSTGTVSTFGQVA